MCSDHKIILAVKGRGESPLITEDSHVHLTQGSVSETTREWGELGAGGGGSKQQQYQDPVPLFLAPHTSQGSSGVFHLNSKKMIYLSQAVWYSSTIACSSYFISCFVWAGGEIGLQCPVEGCA